MILRPSKQAREVLGFFAAALTFILLILVLAVAAGQPR